jgi:hypothetical protein
VNIVCSLEGELFASDSLDDSRGADERSELRSVLSHGLASEWLCQAKAPPPVLHASSILLRQRL